MKAQSLRTFRKQDGFTIVELLIVVVVIAVLAAITIVAYNGVSIQAKEAAARSIASQLERKVKAQRITSSDGHVLRYDNDGAPFSSVDDFYATNDYLLPLKSSLCVEVDGYLNGAYFSEKQDCVPTLVVGQPSPYDKAVVYVSVNVQPSWRNVTHSYWNNKENRWITKSYTTYTDGRVFDTGPATSRSCAPFQTDQYFPDGDCIYQQNDL